MKLLSLQVLRGLAALLVVVFHAQSVCPAYAHGASQSAALMGRFGSYGVDLFFVLSGFIIRYTEPPGGHEARSFLRRRVCRVVPLYWLLTLAAVGLGFLSAARRLPELGHLLQSLGFAAFSSGRQPLLYVGWSLEFEMFFYLATFACLLSSRSPWRSLVIGLSCLSLLGSALELGQVRGLDSARQFFLDPLVLEFALGVLLAGLVRTRALDRSASCALGLALLGVVFTRWADVCAGAQPGRVIVAGVPAALLVAASVAGERRGWLPAPALLVRLGDASYSTYLLQVFLLSAFARLGVTLFGAPRADVLVAFASFGTVASSVAFHRVVEMPLGSWVSRRVARVAQRAGSHGEAGAVL